MQKLNENLIRKISHERNEPQWLTDWRLDAFAKWKTMTEPHWAEFEYSPIDYESLNYYNAPQPVDNSDLEHIYDKMGLPDSEKKALMGMATDTVIDSRSVHTSYTEELKKHGIIFLPFSDAVQQYPELVKKYLGTVVPNNDNFFAAKGLHIGIYTFNQISFHDYNLIPRTEARNFLTTYIITHTHRFVNAHFFLFFFFSAF